MSSNEGAGFILVESPLTGPKTFILLLRVDPKSWISSLILLIARVVEGRGKKGRKEEKVGVGVESVLRRSRSAVSPVTYRNPAEKNNLPPIKSIS